jgi:hypothetical protein
VAPTTTSETPSTISNALEWCRRGRDHAADAAAYDEIEAILHP